MKTKQVISALVLVCGCFISSNAQQVGPFISNQSTIATTVYGKVQGYLDGDIYTFKGIQYAEADRFMPPTDPKPFDGVHILNNHLIIT